MKLIPVLDLMGGQVVRAVRGERARYAPLRSALCPGSAPLPLARALLGLHPFTALYLADLDAILGRGDNLAAITALHRALPALELWVDCGIADAAGLRAWMQRGPGRPVLGSESLADAGPLFLAESARALLSLDFRAGAALDPAGVGALPGLWPREVIVMSLDRVGSGEGPDVGRLARCRRQAPDRAFYAAGGVRGPADIEALAAAGAAGALLASSLHDGTLTRADLARLAG